MRWLTRAALIRLTIIISLLIVLISWIWWAMLYMPGSSYQGKLVNLTSTEQILRDNLEQDVEKISGEIGEHNYVLYDNLEAVAQFLETSLSEAGYQVNSQEYEVNNQKFRNLEVEITGSEKADEIVVVGAHYDSVFGSPGANDNGTGTAAVLALARAFADQKPPRTLRFVEFVNEEPPFFWTEQMGSLVYAKRCRERNEKVVAMLSLETMGYYSDQANSQSYPISLLKWIYPNKGNFIAFIGNLDSGDLVRQVIGNFRKQTKFPSEGTILPNIIPGVGWSDHWSFWQQGYQALMVTDTAPNRYPYYHTSEDTPNKVNYEHLAQVVGGLEKVISRLLE